MLHFQVFSDDAVRLWVNGSRCFEGL